MKITHYTKNQEIHNLDRQLPDANNEINQMLKLSGKDFKSAIIIIPQQTHYKFSLNKLKIENLSREIKAIKKSQVKIRELNISITEIKNSLEGSMVNGNDRR